MALGTALTIGSILAKLGQGYYAGRDLEKAQREQDRRVGYSNLINAFGGRSVPSPVQVKPGTATSILGGLGTALGAGASIYDMMDAKKLRDLQIKEAEYRRNIQEGIEEGLSAVPGGGGGGGAMLNQLGKTTTTGGGVGPYLGAGTGGMEEDPITLPETTVTAETTAPSPEVLLPLGRRLGQFQGRQMLQESQRAQLQAIEPFLEFYQEQGQLKGTIEAVTQNPALFDTLPPAERSKIIRFLSPEVLAAATQRPMTEGTIADLSQSQQVLGKVNNLQEMMKEAVSRNITGPISGNWNAYVDSNSLVGELGHKLSPFAGPRTDFVELADDELLVQIETTAQSLIPTLRSVTFETGVMTEKDEARIANQLPSITGINDTRELAKLPRLIAETESMIAAHLRALGGQRFNVGIESFGPTDQELWTEFLRRYNLRTPGE